MSADTDIVRDALLTFRAATVELTEVRRAALAALARIEAAEQQRDTLADALHEVIPVIEDETFHPAAAETSFGVHGCEPCRVRQVVLDALASVEPRVPTEGRAR